MNLKIFLSGIALFIGLGLVAYLFNQNSQQSKKPLVEKQQKFEVWQLKPGSIDDGDTLSVVKDNSELKIRFCGIDAPEEGQKFSIEARDHLRELVALGNGELLIVKVEKDDYQRTIAEVYVQYSMNSAIHLNMQMVRDGYAFWYYAHDNCPNQESFILAEELARKESLGIWNAP